VVIAKQNLNDVLVEAPAKFGRLLIRNRAILLDVAGLTEIAQLVTLINSDANGRRASL